MSKKLTVKDLNEWFDIYNQKLFNNKLPRIEIKISHGKTRLGCYKYIGGSYRAGTIFISNAYDFDDNKFKEILIHEMIHAYIHVMSIHDNGPHGKHFKAMMNKVNNLLLDENITISIKIDTEGYGLTNKVMNSFFVFNMSGDLVLFKSAKSRIDYFVNVMEKVIKCKYLIFNSDSDTLNKLPKCVSALSNVFSLTNPSNVNIKNEVLKSINRDNLDDLMEKEKEKDKDITSEENKTTIYAVHIAKDIFNIDISENIMYNTIFNPDDKSIDECLDVIANSINYGLLPVSVNGIMDAIIMLAKDAYNSGYGGLNGFDKKYINK